VTTNWPRLTIALDPDIKPRIDAVKRDKFWDKSKGETLRYLIELGLEKYEKEKKSQ